MIGGEITPRVCGTSGVRTSRSPCCTIGAQPAATHQIVHARIAIRPLPPLRRMQLL